MNYFMDYRIPQTKQPSSLEAFTIDDTCEEARKLSDRTCKWADLMFSLEVETKKKGKNHLRDEFQLKFLGQNPEIILNFIVPEIQSLEGITFKNYERVKPAKENIKLIKAGENRMYVAEPSAVVNFLNSLFSKVARYEQDNFTVSVHDMANYFNLMFLGNIGFADKCPFIGSIHQINLRPAYISTDYDDMGRVKYSASKGKLYLPTSD